MKELYIEGVATHDDPESCAGARKGTVEALTGENAGRAIEPRKHQNSDADAVNRSGRPHAKAQKRACFSDPTRSKNLSMRGHSRRENREILRPPEADGAPGRGGKARAASHR